MKKFIQSTDDSPKITTKVCSKTAVAANDFKVAADLNSVRHGPGELKRNEGGNRAYEINDARAPEETGSGAPFFVVKKGTKLKRSDKSHGADDGYATWIIEEGEEHQGESFVG
jgi:hypothetical protein